MSWVEAKWTVDQILQKIGQAPNNMRSFSAFSVSKTEIGLRFLEPEDSYAEGNLICSVGGVMIRMSEEGFPKAPHEGTLVIDNKELGKYQTEEFVVSGLKQGKTYYFSAFPYSVQGVYNLSASEANREEAQPLPGETVNVTVTIDDDSAFTSAIVTCVDETNPTATKTATITPSKLTGSFVVPIGDTYHLEYGVADGYSKPDNTSPKVSVAGVTTEYRATYYYFTATINVTYPQGATLTCTLGDTVYTADTTTGTYAFKVHEKGTWTIKATNGSETDTKQVVISSDGQTENIELAFVRIYGIKRDVTNPSPAWTRTDEAVGMTAKASVGTVAGSSDFDKVMPWKGIVRENIGSDVMVKIPKFYYKRYKEGNTEHIKIATGKTEGFTVHPLFNHAGVEKNFAFVGAYETSSNNKSVSGAQPTVDQDRAIMRDNAKAKGAGWGLIDVSAWSAIQMLVLVEYANNDVQKVIGKGYCDGNSSPLVTGTCNNVPNLTGRPAGTDGKTDVVYRGIEGIWGNVHEWIDGVILQNNRAHVCNDISKYNDKSLTGYTKLSYPLLDSVNFIREVGLDSGENTHVMFPSEGTASGTTYYCDKAVIGNPTMTMYGAVVSGAHRSHEDAGIFMVFATPSSGGGKGGSRLLYIP